MMSNIRKVLDLIINPRKMIVALNDRGMFNWLPDKVFLKLIYRSYTGKKLDIKNPVTFNEKLQWLKLYDRQPRYTNYVDKYLVREHVKEKIGEEYLIPLIEVYDDTSQINWNSLPDKFVLKCTHGSGTNIICSDKKTLNIEDSEQKLNMWMNKNWYWFGREWPYKNVKPRIIAESFLEDNESSSLRDFKLMVFNGEVKFTFVASDRQTSRMSSVDFFDLNWNKMNVGRPGKPHSNEEIIKPLNYEKMIKYAEILAENIPFVRVDFYEVNGELYFGEMTFYPAAGFSNFEPDKYDEIFGEWIELPTQTVE